MNYRQLKSVLETFTEDQLNKEILACLESEYNSKDSFHRIDFVVQDDSNEILDKVHPYFELKDE